MMIAALVAGLLAMVIIPAASVLLFIIGFGALVNLLSKTEVEVKNRE